MAIENPLVRADLVEVTEYPEISRRYQVYGVPLTVVNDRWRIEGGMPEDYFVERVLQAVPPTLEPAPGD